MGSTIETGVTMALSISSIVVILFSIYINLASARSKISSEQTTLANPDVNILPKKQYRVDYQYLYMIDLQLLNIAITRGTKFELQRQHIEYNIHSAALGQSTNYSTGIVSRSYKYHPKYTQKMINEMNAIRNAKTDSESERLKTVIKYLKKLKAGEISESEFAEISKEITA